MAIVDMTEKSEYLGEIRFASVDPRDIHAMHTINNGLTINLKNGTSVGLIYSDPVDVFKKVASALGAEDAKRVKISLNSEKQTPEGVEKAKAYLTLDQYLR